MNHGKKRTVEDESAPSRNDEFLIYQALVGTWPLEPLDADGRANYIERIQQYLLKATHEAKANTSWVSPNEAYEQGTHEFIAAILDPSRRNPFLADFESFAKRVSQLGIWNSLSQTVLKLTCPGVPDIYQGTELWDFSLVDPDNRRPVDYARRQEIFQRLRQRSEAGRRRAGRTGPRTRRHADRRQHQALSDLEVFELAARPCRLFCDRCAISPSSARSRQREFVSFCPKNASEKGAGRRPAARCRIARRHRPPARRPGRSGRTRKSCSRPRRGGRNSAICSPARPSRSSPRTNREGAAAFQSPRCEPIPRRRPRARRCDCYRACRLAEFCVPHPSAHGTHLA